MNQLPIFLLSLSLATAGSQQDSTKAHDSSYTKVSHHKMTISEVLKKNTPKWMEIPGVTGTGEGKSDGKPCIMVLIDHKSEVIEKKIPKTMDGYKVILEVTGEIKAR